jgi:hypothetical protein
MERRHGTKLPGTHEERRADVGEEFVKLYKTIFAQKIIMDKLLEQMSKKKITKDSRVKLDKTFHGGGGVQNNGAAPTGKTSRPEQNPQ